MARIVTGNYHELVRQLLQELGFQAKRQPLSGALGGEYSGDIIWKLGRLELVVEVKYRDKSNFPNPFTVVRDVAFYKRKAGTPKTLVIFDGDVFERDIAPLLTKKKRASKTELSEEWMPTDKQQDTLNDLLGVEINHDIEATKFRDHHRSKGNTFKRPDLAYKNGVLTPLSGEQQQRAVARLMEVGDPAEVDESGHFAGLSGLDDF